MNLPPELEAIRRLTEAGPKVKLGQGVVARTSACALALMVVWGVALWKLSGDAWMNVAVLFGALVVTGVFVWFVRSTQNYAAKHPALAALEGMEFVQYKRLEAEAKGLVPGSPSPIVPDPTDPPKGALKIRGPDKEARR